MFIKSLTSGLAGLCVAAGLMISAQADASALTLGAYAHNVSILSPSGREHGGDIQLGWRSNAIPSWSAIGRPSVYGFVSKNTSHYTNFASAGLAWEFKLGASDHWYARPGLGLAFQDSYALLPDFRLPGLSQAEIARRVALRKDHIEFGSRWLFEPEMAFGYRLNSGDAIEFSYVHISNGQILHHGENQGMDDAGIRWVHPFGQ